MWGQIMRPGIERLQRLDAGSGGILPDTEEIWPIFNRSVCIVSKCTTTEVLQLETKSQCSSSRCSSATVVPLWVPVCFSSICPHQQGHPLIQNGHLTLGAWLVSGIPCQVANFQKILSRYTMPRGENQQQNPYDSAWNLWVSWCKSRSVNPFRHLWKISFNF